MFPIYLPLWLVRRLPEWWRVRRLARMIRNFEDRTDRWIA